MYVRHIFDTMYEKINMNNKIKKRFINFLLAIQQEL